MNKKYQRIFLVVLLVILLIYTCSIKLSAQTQPPNFLWAVSGGGNGYDGAADITVDTQDNIIVAGYFDSTATFQGISLTSAGGSDIFIAKYTNAGNIIWAVSAGSNSYDQAYSVTTDRLGNIIISGIFSNTAYFGTDSIVSSGGYDIFTAKYSTDGVFQWVQKGGGQGYDLGYEVTTDNQNNILVTGIFTQYAVFGDSVITSGNPYGDIYVVKYNPSGVVQWVKAAINPSGGSSFYNASYGVRTDANNNVFITGSFSSVIAFGDTNLVSSWDGTNEDVFLAKYNPQGGFDWVASAGCVNSGGYYYGNDVSIDKDNNILVTGSFNGSALFGGLSINGLESSDIFIVKYDQSGNALWVTQDHSSLLYNDAGEIGLDAAGNISLIANVSQDIIGGELNDVYFARYSNTGQKMWGIRAGLLNGNSAGGLVNDSKGDIYGCGYFNTSATFGTITLNGVNSDAFIAKLPAPQFSIIPPQVNFGSIPTLTLDSALVQLTNTSQADLHIFNMTLVNDTSGSFGIISGYPVDSIPALQTANMEFIFVPVYTGLKSAYMEIVSDAPTSPDTLFLSGTGVLANLVLSDSVLNFGSIDVGLTSPLNLSLINTSFTNIIIDSAAISGANASDFSFSPAINGDTLTFLNYLNLNINFTPSASGVKTANFIVYSTAASSPDTVQLTGTGLSLIQVQVPPPLDVGQSTPISITPPTTTSFISSEIFYRRAGEILYQQDTLQHQGNVYTYNIPGGFSTISGIQFYVMFNDGFSLITYPSVNPITNPAFIQVSIPVTNYPTQIKTSQYQMISIPLSISSPEIDSVFKDDYGPYDPKVWRIFRWQPGINNYDEYQSIGDIMPGNAYWLINRDGKTFNVKNSLSVPAFNNYTITLQPGYNQVGNPFSFSVNWASIGNTDSIPQLPILWNADSLDYEFDLVVYEPWVGYWVYNPLNHIIDLSVNPNLSIGKEKSINYFTYLKNDEFLIQLKAFLSSSGFKDQQNYVGMMEDAKSDMDKYDIIKPPAINNDLKVLIESGENYFARNVVPVSKDGAYWDFTIQTKESNQKVVLNVERKSSLPANFNIWLLDISRKVPVALNNGTGLVITQENGKGSFRIIVGTEEYAKLHSDNIALNAFEYVLYQNYPNPFNPSTNITYQLKEKSDVTLEIYNILGERVMSIVNNVVQDPGQYIMSWNGRNSSGEKVASGIYIYRIIANEFISSKKMILLK